VLGCKYCTCTLSTKSILSFFKETVLPDSFENVDEN
jgi:hypothetical protein